MQDQREKFSARGLTVDYVGSSVEGAHERIRRGMCQLVYVSACVCVSGGIALQPPMEGTVTHRSVAK